jgi:GrpB-like predicted nucleotidyltransferase (UPF0157 family)
LLSEAIAVVDYDATWPARYARERTQLLTVLLEAVDIQHIGSTAVPGLAATPVIDILVAVPQLGPAEDYIERLAPLSYQHRRAKHDRTRLFFWKVTPRTHHVHIVAAGSAEHQQHLRFRDYLRAQPEMAQAYAALKRELAARYGSDRDGYVRAKTDFIQAHILEPAAEG